MGCKVSAGTPGVTPSRHPLNIYGDGVAWVYPALHCFLIWGKFFTFPGLSFPQRSNLGWSTLEMSVVPGGEGGLLQQRTSFIFEMNFLPMVSGTCAAVCICKPVINDIGSRGRDLSVKESAQAPWGLPQWSPAVATSGAEGCSGITNSAQLGGLANVPV